MRPDPAILAALSIPSTATVTFFRHGGSGFSETGKLVVTTTTVNQPATSTTEDEAIDSTSNENVSTTSTSNQPSISSNRQASSTNRNTSEPTTPKKETYFTKLSASKGAEIMFQGEFESLNAINNAVPTLCPRALAWGECQYKPGTFFLVTEFLDFSTGRGGKGSGEGLAAKLARLHSADVGEVGEEGEGDGEGEIGEIEERGKEGGIEEGGKEGEIEEGKEAGRKGKYGFHIPTCCGNTIQDNSFCTDWAEFFAERRLRSILLKGEERNGVDKELHALVLTTISVVVPRLLGKGHLGGEVGIKPSLIHGDLWSGNYGIASILKQSPTSSVHQSSQSIHQAEDIIFDPSSSYSHSEFELSIMKMFGGFGSKFWREYHELIPKTEPVGEYEDRLGLYQSYHYLNHWAIFGGSYIGSAAGIMRGLCRKYS